jgi:hypothetical protein
MSNENLQRVRDEINTAIEIATNANTNIEDISAIDADTFKQIARPLRRALRLVEPTARHRSRLDLSIESDEASEGEVREWELDGVIYGHMLHHRACPPAFREAFNNIVIEHLLKPCVTEGVHEIDVLFPLAVLALQGWIPAEAYRTVLVLRTLRDTLAPELYKEILDALKQGVTKNK